MLKLKMVVSVSELKGECIGKAKKRNIPDSHLFHFVFNRVINSFTSFDIYFIWTRFACFALVRIFLWVFLSISVLCYRRSNSIRQWHSSILIEKVFSSSEEFSTTDENNLARLPKTIMIVHLFSLGSHKFCASLSQLSILFKCFHFDFSFYMNESGSVNVVITAACYVTLLSATVLKKIDMFRINRALCFVFFCVLCSICIVFACTFQIILLPCNNRQ